MIKLSAGAKFRMFLCAAAARIRPFLGPAGGRLPFLGAIAGVCGDAVSGSTPTETLKCEGGRQRLDAWCEVSCRTCGGGKLNLNKQPEAWGGHLAAVKVFNKPEAVVENLVCRWVDVAKPSSLSALETVPWAVTGGRCT